MIKKLIIPTAALVALAAVPASAGAASSADLAVYWNANHDAYVVNYGPSTAYNVTLTEHGPAKPFPSVLSPCVSGFLGVTCTWASVEPLSLAPAQQPVARVRWEAATFTGKGPLAVTMTATVSSSTPDPNPSNNVASLRLACSCAYFYFGG